MNKIDLHIHTQYSDGTDSVASLIPKLKKAGIDTFSITDHNTTAAYEEASGLDLQGMKLVPGVEISCSHLDLEFHILVYGQVVFNPIVQNLIAGQKKATEDADSRFMRDISTDLGFELDDYDAYTYQAERGGWKALNFLLDRKMIKSRSEFFKLWDNHVFTAEYIPAAVLLSSLNLVGAKAVLAHPCDYQDNDRLSIEFLDTWREMGLAGIEVYCPHYSDPSNSQYYLDYCRKHRLMISAGSDYHGKVGSTKLGVPSITADDLK